MSAEQAGGASSDKQADNRSFGVVLFEMLTEHQVFSGNTVSRVLAAVLAKDPQREAQPTNLNPKIRELLQNMSSVISPVAPGRGRTSRLVAACGHRGRGLAA